MARTKTTRESKYAHQLRSMSTEDLADEMRFISSEIRTTRNDMYRAEQSANFALISAEIERRENGGQVQISQPRECFTDGERIALGLNDASDGI